MKKRTSPISDRQNRGFTLIEILVVLAIIGLLAGLIGPQVMKQFSSAKPKTARLQVEQLVSALDLYRLDTGRYPSNEQGLDALIHEPEGARNWNGPYLRKSVIPQDPWGRDYAYVFPGKNADFEVYSLGEDGQTDGDGDNADINSWK